ncbi:MAG: type II toxin-antitoxin system RelB/DinJ family antitoxin [Candidatus Zambryskibacteria bacterium]|nr:type II toxin-antitoxin system RelB/DinJ family antitoxin [Candidatus Zambryskibacteria bacterium]
MATKTNNTKTLLTVKIDKTLKASAQKTAEEIGLPLGTLVNSMLRGFVRDQEITLSAISYQPSKSTIRAIKEAEKEYEKGDYQVAHSVEELMTQLNS